MREIADHELASKKARPDAPPSPERLLELARHDLSRLQGTHKSLKEEHAKETSNLDSEITATTRTLQERERGADVATQDIMGLEQSVNEATARLRERRKELATVRKEIGQLTKDVRKQDGRRTTLRSKQRRSIEQSVEDIHNKEDELRKLQAEIDAQLQEAARSVIGEVVTQKEEAADPQPKAAIPETGSSADMTTTSPSQLIGNNAICYEAIQRVFRNTVVNFIRDRLSIAFQRTILNRCGGCLASIGKGM